MATSVDFIEFVCEQIKGYEVRYKKMFGEYMVYVNNKPILLICDNVVYIKKLPQIEKIMASTATGTPYKGAKEHYILDIENEELVDEVIAILEIVTPVPKQKKEIIITKIKKDDVFLSSFLH